MRLDYNRYYRYHALVEALEDLQRAYPNLAKLYSIGKSYEGRDIWCVELTNQATGPSEEKPGFYLDGNTHAGEVTGTMVCLYTIDWLLSNYGIEDQATRLLDTKTIYVLPRICPDGAELYLTTPYTLRSTVHEWVFPHYADPSGLEPQDINGDGHILQMRVRDDVAGDWKISATDPRLMVRRMPDDFGGAYYHVFSEGIIHNYDGFSFSAAPARWGLDMNRNYPINWKPPHIQRGAGPTPLSEPESKAVTEFMLSKKNLAGAIYYHTSGGILLRPNCVEGDEKMIPADLATYIALGVRGEEITGYPCQDIYGVFAGNTAQWGTFMDLSYEYLGISSFAVELWDLMGRSGIKEKSFSKIMRLSPAEQEEIQMKTLRWNDEVMGGSCFINWTSFNHPQLGEVEIGGWNPKEGRQNPPLPLLAEECEKNMRFSFMHMETLPQLAISGLACEALGNDVWRITGAVENIGFLPSSSSHKAVQNRMTPPVKATICGADILQGEAEIEIGHLQGRSAGLGQGPYNQGSPAGSKKKIEWIVKGCAGSAVTITAVSERAGTARACVKLG